MTRRGFTLIEVLVALTLTGFVAMLVGRVFTGVADGAKAASRFALEQDRAMNAERWLVEALGSIAVGMDGDSPFDGTPDRLRCAAWIRVPGGWLERQEVELGYRDGRLEALVGTDTVVVFDNVDAAALDYLMELGATSRWVSRWQSPVSAPLAVRLRVTHGPGGRVRADTLLVLIGGRG